MRQTLVSLLSAASLMVGCLDVRCGQTPARATQMPWTLFLEEKVIFFRPRLTEKQVETYSYCIREYVLFSIYFTEVSSAQDTFMKRRPLF